MNLYTVRIKGTDRYLTSDDYEFGSLTSAIEMGCHFDKESAQEIVSKFTAEAESSGAYFMIYKNNASEKGWQTTINHPIELEVGVLLLTVV